MDSLFCLFRKSLIFVTKRKCKMETKPFLVGHHCFETEVAAFLFFPSPWDGRLSQLIESVLFFFKTSLLTWSELGRGRFIFLSLLLLLLLLSILCTVVFMCAHSHTRTYIRSKYILMCLYVCVQVYSSHLIYEKASFFFGFQLCFV